MSSPHSPRTTMQCIPHELLPRILSLLEATDDQARCSAVSRGWAAASAEARPTKLHIHRIRRDDEPSYSAVTELQWLQARQRQNRFQNVQEFVMAEIISSYETQSNSHTTFAQNTVTYAGFWNLHKCDLTGPFCLFSAVGTLPTTLQSLFLRPAFGPREFASSAFQRFAQLEFLDLAWSADNFPCNFELDCTLDSLCTLDLSGTLDMICSCATNCNIGACMPNISTFRGRVKFDQEGEDIACSLAVSKHLQELELVLVDAWDNITFADGLFLRDNPRLAIASTELLVDLRIRLKDVGVSYRPFLMA